MRSGDSHRLVEPSALAWAAPLVMAQCRKRKVEVSENLRKRRLGAGYRAIELRMRAVENESYLHLVGRSAPPMNETMPSNFSFQIELNTIRSRLLEGTP